MQRYLVNSPVLLIFYNRADKAKNILQNLIDTKNNFSKLIIKVDGPKNEEDSIKVNKVIEMINLYKKNFNNLNISIEKKNLGLQQNIIRSIDDVLEKEETVIVLEDDQLVSKQFFEFCDLMLLRFKDNKKIFQISGSCYLPDRLKKNDIFFSKFADCVGWATWKRSWKKLRRKLSLYEVYKNNKIKNYYNDLSITHWFYEYLYREHTAFEKKGLWSTWWQLSIIYENGFCVNPMKNLAIHDGLDIESSPEHYNKSYEPKKKIICEEILLSEIKNYNVEYAKELDKHNINMIKKTDPIFKILNRFKWVIKFYPRIYSLKNISKTI